MATSSSMAVKCLNTSPGRKRFVFKSFSQRVEDINIDVFRSLEPVKAEPSTGSSFFRESLLQWRELNTAEDFISFYEEMMPLVQTLPQIILHREKIFSELLCRLNMKARLSLEPILMLIAALSRDILEEFLPFLEGLNNGIIDLLKHGGDSDPEILEQVFTSWSYITMYLQKYLVKDVVLILKITVRLRFFPKDYVREFMAEAVSFLLRNAPINQLMKGLKRAVLEVAKCSLVGRKNGVTALLWHTMKGTSGRLHSRSEKVLKFLIDRSTLDMSDKFPQGSSALIEVIAGVLSRLYDEMDEKQLNLIYPCLFEEITHCIDNGHQEHLNRVIGLLIFAINYSNQSKKALNAEATLKLVQTLIHRYVVSANDVELENLSSEVLKSILQLMLCLLDVAPMYSDLHRISLLYAPAFQLISSSVLDFIKELLTKYPQISDVFICYILSAMENFVETFPEDVIFILLTLFRRQSKLLTEVKVDKICNFFKTKLCYWTKLLKDTAETVYCTYKQVSEEDAAILWGIVICYPYFQNLQDDLGLLKDLINSLDRALESEADNMGGIPKTTWQSLLGAVMVSYKEVLLVNNCGHSERNFFLSLARRHKTSPQVLSAVAEFLNSLLGKSSAHEVYSGDNQEPLSVQNTVDLCCMFADNLSVSNKAARISTLRILSHYVRTDQCLSTMERPHKRLKTEESALGNENDSSTNVIELLLSIETTPLSISTSRKIVILISRIKTGLSAGKISNNYVPLLLHGILGILYNRYSDLWEPALECLAILFRKYKDLVWNIFVQYLAAHQSEALSSGNRSLKLDTEIQPVSLLGCFKLFLTRDFDCTPCVTMTTLLLRLLQKIPDIAEPHSRQLVPLFLNFLGYEDNAFSVESYTSDKCKGKDWRTTLEEWLNLLRLLRNARSLYRSKFLQEVLIKRLLDEIDSGIQLKVLDCLMNWREEFLVPYEQHLKNLAVSKNLREELTTWDVSKALQSIEEEHRGHLVALIIHLLTPKVRTLKTLGSRKHTGLNYRKAILRFFLQFDVNELRLFFCLLLKPLLPRPLLVEVFDSRSDSLPENITDRFLSSVIAKVSYSISADNPPLKKINGFLHVAEEVFEAFDMTSMKPFLNPLLMIVVRILESCARSLTVKTSSNSHSVGENSSGSFKVHQKELSSPDFVAMRGSMKQFKDIRTLCLKIIALSLHKYSSHDFGSDFWDDFFTSVKPLIDGFKQEGSSSEKPSSLFSCFIAMSQSPTLVSLLGMQANLVPTIFSILNVKTASDAIISSVLDFIENLLKLDHDLDHQGDDVIKKVLVPHIEVLINSFRNLFQSRKELHRKSTNLLGRRELKIFKLLVNYIEDQAVASHFIDILLPFFRKRDLNSDDCSEGLYILKRLIPILGSEASGKILSSIHSLLVTAELDLRLCICDILDSLATQDSSLSLMARLVRNLNAVSTSEPGERDYDARIEAYNAIRPQLFCQLVEEHAVTILSHCVYDMSSDELLFRQSASRALESFMQFAAFVMNRSTNGSTECLLHEATSMGKNDIKSMESCIASTWTKTCIHQIIDNIYLHNIGEAMSKDISIQKEWIALLREMVCNFQHVLSLSSLRLLCSENPDEDFFINIVHLQLHNRAKALSRFREKVSAGNFSEEVTMKIFVRLVFTMLFVARDGKEEYLKNACVETIASIAAQVRWEAYRTILMRCFHELTLKPDKQKILLRLLCAVLDAFHFSDVNSESVGGDCQPDALNFDNRKGRPREGIVPSEKQLYLQKAVLPQIQKLMTLDAEKINVSISLVALKLFKLLPEEIMESHLSSIIHRICNFLRNRLESIRNEARSALAACLKELGLKYLKFIVKILQAILKRGYELHVLGYTLNFLLSKTLKDATVGELDYCLEELLSITEIDILGNVSEEKEVDKIASKMKETKKSKSFETLKLIAVSITFRTHALKLLSPISTHLQRQLSPKMKAKLGMMLQNIALGIECNPSTETSELLIFLYGLVEDSIREGNFNNKEMAVVGANGKSVEEPIPKRSFLGVGVNMQNYHLITEFSLRLLRNRLKSNTFEMKNDQWLAMLDPFVRLLEECLNSKHENVLSAAFRCLALLIKLPLPSLESHADKIKDSLLEISHKSGNANSPLMQSCLKLLTDLLTNTRISLSVDQLHLLIHFPIFIDLQVNPSPVALSLLRSIISRKLMAHEIYDIVLRVAELMVTSQSESIRKKCGQILLQFLLDYRLSEKRLQQHIDFLLSNLSYEHSTGREAVLEMLHVILVKFPKSIIDAQAQTLFLHLVVALANETDQKVRSMVATTLQMLIGRCSQTALHLILEYSLSWYKGEKRHLWSAAAEVLGLLVEVVKKGVRNHLGSILSAAKCILQSSLPSGSSTELHLSNGADIPCWKEAYYSLFMLEKMLLQFPELCFDQNIQEMWLLVCKFLLHPYILLRNISSSLVALYFSSVPRARSHDLESGSLVLVNPSALFVIAVSFANQLRTELSNAAAINLVFQNLVFSICHLHNFVKKRKCLALHQYWSALGSSEQESFLKGFELLGSSKAKSRFLLCTASMGLPVSAKDQSPSLDMNEDIQFLVVAPILKRMGKIAMQMGDTQTKIVFNCFRMISINLGFEGSLSYARHMLLPLYKVCEGFAGKIIGDGVKQLAEEVRNSIRDQLGFDQFVQVYNQIRKNLKKRREKRKQSQTLLAVINPQRYAKRKLRIAAKHQTHKRRKLTAMKMGKWKR